MISDHSSPKNKVMTKRPGDKNIAEHVDTRPSCCHAKQNEERADAIADRGNDQGRDVPNVQRVKKDLCHLRERKDLLGFPQSNSISAGLGIQLSGVANKGTRLLDPLNPLLQAVPQEWTESRPLQVDRKHSFHEWQGISRRWRRQSPQRAGGRGSEQGVLLGKRRA